MNEKTKKLIEDIFYIIFLPFVIAQYILLYPMILLQKIFEEKRD